MTTHRVPDGVQSISLARYLQRAWPCAPSAVIRGALRRKDVRVNGARAGAGTKVQGGDELRLYIEDRFLTGSVRTIDQDEGLLCVEKPPGLPVDADAQGIGCDTLIARVRAQFPSARLCHRLDEGTGGALLCSLTEVAHDRVLRAFRERRAEKTYQAVALGCPKAGQARLTGYLLKDSENAKARVFSAPYPGALPIETGYRVLKARLDSSETLSLLEIDLITGRTHQIRAHLAHAGYPLLGDDKYGDRALNKRIGVTQPQLWCTRLALLGKVFESKPRFLTRRDERMHTWSISE